ncbi:hypothetical protein EG833_02470, partial [archaeon]|nr:hypothetical protein [archaeon]
MMKKLSLLVLLSFFLPIPPALCLDINVDIKGPQELVSLKDGIIRTLQARCLARNPAAEEGSPLNVSLIQLGDTISFDAVLNANPPRAFHKDLKSIGELSPAIDQMIEGILMGPAPKALREEKPLTVTAPETPAEIKLPFTATSMAVINGTVFVSSEDSIYRIIEGKPQPYGKPRQHYSIYRLFPHQDSLLAVCCRDKSSFKTFMIKDGSIIREWDGCAVPLGDSLIGSSLITDYDITDGQNKWKKTEILSGNPGKTQIPEGQDILSMLVSDISPGGEGEEIASFDIFKRITIKNGKSAIWTSDTSYGSLPLYVVSKPKSMASASTTSKKSSKEARENYYLMPRILQHGKDILT